MGRESKRQRGVRERVFSFTSIILAMLIAFALGFAPGLANAEGDYIRMGFSANAQLNDYHARSGNSYYAVGSVDGSAVQDADGNTWPGYGVVAVAFEPISDVGATSIESIVESVQLTYGSTPTVSITFAAGVDISSAVDKVSVVSTGLTTDFDITAGSLGSVVGISGQTLTLDTTAGISSSPVTFKLTFSNFSTPAGLPVGTFYVWARGYGLSGTSQTSAPEITKLDIQATSDTFDGNSFIKAFFDEAVRINQSPSEADSRNKTNTVLVKADSSNATIKKNVLDSILDDISTTDKKVELNEVTADITSAGSSYSIAVDLNGNSSFLSVTDGGSFATPGGGATPTEEVPPAVEEGLVTSESVTEAAGAVTDTLAEIELPPAGGTVSEEVVTAVNDVMGDTGDVIENAATLLDEGTMNVDEAVDAVNILDDTMAAGAAVAGAGGAIDTSAVADTLVSVDNLVDAAIAQKATAGQMSEMVTVVDSVMNDMDEVMGAAKDVTEAVEVLSSVDDVVGAGITAAVYAGAAPAVVAGMVNNVGKIVTEAMTAAAEPGEAATVADTGQIVQAADDIIARTVSALEGSGASQDVAQEVMAQVQVEVTGIADTVASNLDQAAPAEVTVEQVRGVMEGMTGMAGSIVGTGASLSEALVTGLQEVTQEALQSTIGDIAEDLGLVIDVGAVIVDEAAMRQALAENPQALDNILEVVSVDLTDAITVEAGERAQVLESGLGLSAQDATEMAQAMPELPDAAQDVAMVMGESASPAGLIETTVQSLVPDTSVTVDSTTGVTSVNVAGTEFPVYVNDVRVVPPGVSEGLHVLPQGMLINVSGGIASTIAPAPRDPVGLVQSLEQGGLSGVQIGQTGDLSVTGPDGNRYVGAFGYGVVGAGGAMAAQDGGQFTAGQVSFSVQGIDPASEAYSVLVQYEDGTVQDLAPTVAGMDQLVSMLDKVLGNSYSINLNNGVIAVGDLAFKPSYVVEPLESDDILSNKDEYGIVWKVVDANGDGLDDLEMVTVSGRQIIYQMQ